MRANAGNIAVVILLMLCIPLGYWLSSHFEFHETRSFEHFSTRAHRDPYLAAQYFLEGLGKHVDRDPLQKQIHHLPRDGAVILTTPSDTLTGPQAQSLLRWLYGGGHLVVIAGANTRRNPDPLMRYFGVHRRYHSPWESHHRQKSSSHKSDGDDASDESKLGEQLRDLARELKSGKPRSQARNGKNRGLGYMPLEGDPRPLRIQFNPYYQLQLPSHSANPNDNSYPAPVRGSIHFLQYDVGKGRLYMVSDLGFWTSHSIGKHEHALALLQLAGTGGNVSLISDVAMPPLAHLLWLWAREVMIAALGLVAAGVWYRGRRFGPIRDPQMQVRRSLAEHIRASARYLWTSGETETLLAPVRQVVQQQAARVFANYDKCDVAARVALLHEATGCRESAIEHALFAPVQHDQAAFRDSVAVLLRLLHQLKSQS